MAKPSAGLDRKSPDQPSSDALFAARCLQRYGISQLPKIGDELAARRKFKAYPIGYFHIDLAEVRTAQVRLYRFVAIDRTSKFAYVELHEKATTRVADLIRSNAYRRAPDGAVDNRGHGPL